MQKKKGTDKLPFILLGAVGCVFVFLLLRILLLQTVSFGKYQQIVLGQYTNEYVVPAERGKILDRNGNPLATNIITYRVAISPKDISEKQESSTKNYAEGIATGLSVILGADKENVLKQIEHYSEYLDRTIARGVNEETAEKVREFIRLNDLSGMIFLEEQSTRYYPGNTLAAHVIGFVGNEGNGLYGLEYQYNSYLKGTDGYYIKARDSYGNEMPYDFASYVEPQNGYTLNTTIDATVQAYLEEQLALAVEKTDPANRACGIVMNVKTGAILAMATSSPFNLNKPSELDEFSIDILMDSGYSVGSDNYNDLVDELRANMWRNKPLTDSYIPGSTFKIITSSMALEEDLVNLTETVNCPGYLNVQGSIIHCHETSGHGELTLAGGLQQSCNVWFMTLGQRVGAVKFQEYLKAFGYYEQTGIDLPGEGYSIIGKDLSFLDISIYGFGQNFNVTPIQQITAISAVANGGYLVTPFVVESIDDGNGNEIYRHTVETKCRVVSEDVCRTISEILEDGVSGDGGANTAAVKGYKIAAKTGTSEKKSVGSEGTYVCSCVGYAPADDPEIAVLILADEPTHTAFYGSTAAAPFVSGTFRNVLPYLGYEPYK